LKQVFVSLLVHDDPPLDPPLPLPLPPLPLPPLPGFPLVLEEQATEKVMTPPSARAANLAGTLMNVDERMLDPS